MDPNSIGVARLPSRAELRELVARNNDEQRAAIRAGANPYQIGLDQNDKIKAYAAMLSSNDRLAFLTIYAEETSAASKQMETDNAHTLTQLAAHEKRQNLKASAIVAGVFTVLVIAVVWWFVASSIVRP